MNCINYQYTRRFLKNNKMTNSFNDISKFILELNKLFVESELVNILHDYYNIIMIFINSDGVLIINDKITEFKARDCIKFNHYIVTYYNEIIIYNLDKIIIKTFNIDNFEYMFACVDNLYICSDIIQVIRLGIFNNFSELKTVRDEPLHDNSIICNDMIIQNDVFEISSLDGKILHSINDSFGECYIHNDVLYSIHSNLVFCLKTGKRLESIIDFTSDDVKRICMINEHVYKIETNTHNIDRLQIHNLNTGKFIKNIHLGEHTNSLINYYDNLIIIHHRKYSMCGDDYEIYGICEPKYFIKRIRDVLIF